MIQRRLLSGHFPGDPLVDLSRLGDGLLVVNGGLNFLNQGQGCVVVLALRPAPQPRVRGDRRRIDTLSLFGRRQGGPRAERLALVKP